MSRTTNITNVKNVFKYKRITRDINMKLEAEDIDGNLIEIDSVLGGNYYEIYINYGNGKYKLKGYKLNKDNVYKIDKIIIARKGEIILGNMTSRLLTFLLNREIKTNGINILEIYK